MSEMSEREQILNHKAMREALAAVPEDTRRRVTQIVADLERVAFVAGWDAHRDREGYPLVDCFRIWQQIVAEGEP